MLTHIQFPNSTLVYAKSTLQIHTHAKATPRSRCLPWTRHESLNPCRHADQSDKHALASFSKGKRSNSQSATWHTPFSNTQRQIRITAAETLWILTQTEDLKRQDWSLPPKTLKPAVDAIRLSLTVGSNT